MRILFFDTKNYDRASFDKQLEHYPGIEIDYLKTDLAPKTAPLAKGFDAVCAFVSSDVGAETMTALHEAGVRLVLMRCAGFNNVDLDKAAMYGIRVMRVPGYSPEAVAEHAMALALTANRRIHKAYVKVRENDFSLSGLMGFNFYQKTAGIVGTGKIGAAMARICRGFGMKVIAFDPFVKQEDVKQDVTMVDLDTLMSTSDFVSIHLPVNDGTRGIISAEKLALMKKSAYLINNARAAVLDYDKLIDMLQKKEIQGAALDVYPIEPLPHDHPLLDLDNVVLTPHIAGCSLDPYDRSYTMLLEDLDRFFKNEEPKRIYNPDSLKK